MSRLVLAFLAVAGIVHGVAQWARACGTAARAGARVEVARESAIIVWDAGSKMQHFIRRATFTSDAPDFGFLVPTPAQPALAESNDAAFVSLEKLTAPKVVKVTEYRLMPPIGCGKQVKSTSKGVRVLDEQRVAGYDAVVLEADSADALNNWLARHHYATRPDLTTWLAPYVKARWKITAFKIARDATRQELASSAVLMSFPTERPFFPYSEPAAQRGPDRQGTGSRLLRVFFIGDRRYEGKLGEAGKWPGETVWSAPLPSEAAQDLATKLKLGMALRPVWLTMFEDRSSPRPGTADVFFVPSPSQEEVRPSPIRIPEYYDVGGWVCLGIVLLPALWLVYLGFRRARRASAPASPGGN